VLGLFIGIVVGLALAAAVAFYLTRGATPYQSTRQSRDSSREPAKELAKPGRADGFAPDKPRFDFYRILPGNEEAKIQPKPAERPADKSTAERAVSPDKADAKSASKADPRVTAKADAYRATLQRCDGMASERIRGDGEFRRLIDGALASLAQVPKAIETRDADLLHRLLIELRSFDNLLAFRFG